MSEDLHLLKKKISLHELASRRTRLEKRGDEWWGCCPFHSEKTPSFSISFKEGEEVFHCFGCGKGGDVIRFVEYTDHCTSGEAIAKLRAFYDTDKKNVQKVVDTFQGVLDEIKPKITISINDWKKFETELLGSGDAIAWLLNERGISLETAQKARLGFVKSCKSKLHPEDEWARDKGWVLFPRISGEKVVAVKLRSIVTKAFAQFAGMDSTALFNTETIDEWEDLFVTEGELDALTMEQCGFHAVSIPNATTKLTVLQKLLLKKAVRIFLAGDTDETGSKAMYDLQQQLGENVYVLKWQGAKDANEFFLKRCSSNVETFRAHIETMKQLAYNEPVQGVVHVIDRLQNAEDTNASQHPRRMVWPWPEVDSMSYPPPNSVVILYSTYTGTGKTKLATQLARHNAGLGRTVVTISLEIGEQEFPALLAAQIIGTEKGELDCTGKITKETYQETARFLEKTYPAELGGPEKRRRIEWYIAYHLPESTTDKNLDFIDLACKVIHPDLLVLDTFHKLVFPKGRESQTEAEGRSQRIPR